MTQQTPTSFKPIMKTIPQLAIMGILPERAIRRLVAERKIPTIKIGNRQYINLSAFERFLNGEQREGDPSHEMKS